MDYLLVLKGLVSVEGKGEARRFHNYASCAAIVVMAGDWRPLAQLWQHLFLYHRLSYPSVQILRRQLFVSPSRAARGIPKWLHSHSAREAPHQSRYVTAAGHGL